MEIAYDKILGILDYCLPEKVRLTKAVLNGRALYATCKFFAPDYTAEPITYLGMSELSNSLSQSCQVLLFLDIEKTQYTKHLQIARNLHRAYFGTIKTKFSHPLVASYYELKVELIGRQKIVQDSYFQKVRFQVVDKIEGHTLICFKLHSSTKLLHSD